MAFLSKNNIFGKPGPMPTSKMELIVTIIDSWKLLTSAASSLDPSWLNYGFQRTEEGCSDLNSLVACVDGERPNFIFIPNTGFQWNYFRNTKHAGKSLF